MIHTETELLIDSENYTLSDKSLALLAAFSSNRNAEKEKEPEPARIDIGDKKHVATIMAYKARKIALHAKKQRVLRSLQLAKHTEFATVVCHETGIVSILEIPAIPGFALTCAHPLAELSNARGIAQQGISYLNKLDMQVLSGILLVLAADYSLFNYQPSDSGAQKNAILRTVQKTTTINAILTIEDMIHSGNHSYLPKLSLIMDTEIAQGGIEDRMQGWLKLVVEAIYKPDTEVWDENETVQRQIKTHNKMQEKERTGRESKLRKEQKIIKEDCKTAITLIKDLFRQELINSKLRLFLGGVFQEFQLITMDPGARLMLAGKLSAINNSASKALSEILNKSRGDLVAKNAPMDDFFTDDPEEKPVRIIASKDDTTKEITEVRVHSIEVATAPVRAGLKRIEVSGKQFLVIEANYFILSFMNKVKYHKALLAGTEQGETE